MTIKLASTLPKHHGLGVIERQLLDAPYERHIVIAVIDCARITMDMDSDEATPVVKVRRIEVIEGDETHLSHAAALLQWASDKRTGQDPLPFDAYVIEDAIHEALHADDDED